MADFKRRDLEQYTDSLAAYLPGGELFASRSVQDSNFRKLLRGLAGELFKANGYLKTYAEEVVPDQTERFLDEWEAALGIPDGCFSGGGTVTQRRRDVLTKLAALGVQTVEDFESLSDLFGISVVVRPGRFYNSFPMEFPFLLFDTVKQSRFTIVVNFTVDAGSKFPYTFPIPFGDDTIGVLECIFRRLKPANCDILFRQV